MASAEASQAGLSLPTAASAKPKCYTMKNRRILISGSIGFAFGLVILACGFFSWLPTDLFNALNSPALFLAGLFIGGEQVLLLMPVTIAVQWTLLGAIVGIVFHLVRGLKRPA